MIPALLVDHKNIVKNTHVLESPVGDPSVKPLAIVLTDDGSLVSRWELTDEERQKIASGGSVYLLVKSQSHPPVSLRVDRPFQDQTLK